MAKNDLTLLDGILEEYISMGLPSSKPDEVFEYFATEQILKDYAFSKDDLLSGSVDGRNDGGIDEFFILVNGHLAERIPTDFWPKDNAKLEVYIITCKHDSSFRQAPITTMIPSLMELLDFSKPSIELEASYNQSLLAKRDLLISVYKRLAIILTKFNINIIYACRDDEIIEPNIQAKADQAENLCQEFFSGCTSKFSFWGNSKLLARYRERPNSTLELPYQQCVTQDSQYIVLAALDDYYHFISDKEGKLNRHLFDANVRDYLGLNPVNIDISASLRSPSGANFWWLNNGITIIGSNAHIIGNVICVENVQIVNGMQTSESIFNYFSEISPESDRRSVLIKIIISNDEATRNAIIYATNNQTNVNVTALRATDKLQKDIEEILKSHQIYYERRTNYYQNQGISSADIITPLALASGYISLMYKDPQAATILKQKFMRNDEKYSRVFSPLTDLNVWPQIAILVMKTDSILAQIRPKGASRFFKKFRQVVLFSTVSRIIGTFAFGEKQLIAFDTNLYDRNEVEKTLADISEIDDQCLNHVKNFGKNFYTKYFKHIANKYGITAIQSISNISSKLWNGGDMIKSLDLSDEIINRVFQELPPQPWPAKIHQKIADCLGLQDYIVSGAIAYLIYTGKVYAQVYGYVFDREDNIVLEGEHYGYTEKEARIKLQEQRSANERKFAF